MRPRFLGIARPKKPPYILIYANIFLSKCHFLLLLVYTNRCNRFVVLINIGNDTSLTQIGYNVDFPVFGQNGGSEKRAWPIIRKRKVGGL